MTTKSERLKSFPVFTEWLEILYLFVFACILFRKPLHTFWDALNANYEYVVQLQFSFEVL